MLAFSRLPVAPVLDSPRPVARDPPPSLCRTARGTAAAHGSSCRARYSQDVASVTAEFGDHTSATGDVLVGADGVHSALADPAVPRRGRAAVEWDHDVAGVGDGPSCVFWNDHGDRGPLWETGGRVSRHRGWRRWQRCSSTSSWKARPTRQLTTLMPGLGAMRLTPMMSGICSERCATTGLISPCSLRVPRSGGSTPWSTGIHCPVGPTGE